jgi:hypothetical protein
LAQEAARLEAVIADAEELPVDKTTIAHLNLRLGWIAVARDNRLQALTAFDETIKHTDDPRLRQAAFQGQDQAKQLRLGGGVAPARAVGIRKLFRGATALSEADHLLGREEELRRLIAQVTSAGTRFFILWGETGGGKSSLARAGLVPALAKEGRFLPVVVRQWNDPIENIRHALAQAAPDVELSQATTLLGCVQRIAAHTGKTVVLVCDQFEQFFAAHPRWNEREAVIKAIGACYNDFGLPCKFVFVVRTDELGRMAEFDSKVAEPLERRKRFHLPLFREEDAARVLRQLAQQAGLEWSDALIQAFVADLTHDGRVRPVELQLTGAALAVSGISTYRDYEQAERAEGLLRDYVQLTLRDLRQSKADETAMKRILLALVSESNTRHSLTFDEIAERTGLKEALTQAHFALIEAHLVSRIDSVGTAAARYELTHDTLVEKVLQLTRTLQDKKRQADRIMKRALEDLKANPRQTIGLRAAYLVWSHADRRAMKHLKVLSLLRRSLGWGITKWIVAPIIGLILTLYVVQNSFGHVTLERDFEDRVVVRRGLPWLGFLPWIGSDIVLDTGFTTNQLIRGKRGQVQGIIHAEWKNLSSGTLAEPDLVTNLSSLPGQGKLWYQAGSTERGIETFLAALTDSDYRVREAAAAALGRVAQADHRLAAQVLSPLLTALKDSDPNARGSAGAALGQVVEADHRLAAQVLSPLLTALKDSYDQVRMAAATALGRVAQVNLQAKESALQSLIVGERNEDMEVRSGVAKTLPDLFVVEAEAEAKSGRDPLEFLFAHLEGKQSYLPTYLPNANANTYAVYRNLLVTAMARWLVSDTPEAKATQAALRQRLETMRASDKRLHLRIAAWNALAQAAELAAKKD